MPESPIKYFSSGQPSVNIGDQVNLTWEYEKDRKKDIKSLSLLDEKSHLHELSVDKNSWSFILERTTTIFLEAITDSGPYALSVTVRAAGVGDRTVRRLTVEDTFVHSGKLTLKA